MVAYSGIGRVEWNRWDIVGRVSKSCIEYDSARDGGGDSHEKHYGVLSFTTTIKSTTTPTTTTTANIKTKGTTFTSSSFPKDCYCLDSYLYPLPRFPD